MTIYTSNLSQECRQWKTAVKGFYTVNESAIQRGIVGALTTEEQVEAAEQAQTVTQAHFVGMTSREQTLYGPANTRFQADMQSIIDAGPVIP